MYRSTLPRATSMKTAPSISAADSRTYTISELAREFGVTPPRPALL